jgi:hypothetical protein
LEKEAELVAKSRSLSTVRNFLSAHALVFAGVVAAPENGSYVLWSDIRFCWSPDGPSAPQIEPFVRSRDAGRIACALWFGGQFDANGNPVREIVKIGGFTQTR